MALPTSVPSNSWLGEAPDSSQVPLLKADATPTASSKTVPPSEDALEFLNLVTGSTELASSSTSSRSLSPTLSRLPDPERRDEREQSTVRRQTPSPVRAILYGEANHSTTVTSSSCTLTSAHQEAAVSAVINASPVIARATHSSNSTVSVTKSLFLVEQNKESHINHTELAVTSDDTRRSTLTETASGCDNGACEGKEMKCRRCGKTIPKAIMMSGNINETSKAGFLENRQCSKSGNCNESDKIANKSFVAPHPPKTYPRPRYYSALLSASSRNVRKKGSRRSSVDVLYAREPTEPGIEKIKSKRRLSRQTDVSSFELMTLTEDNENDGVLQQDSAHIIPKSTKPKINKKPPEDASTRKGPSASLLLNSDRCPQLYESSSTDSCPPAPWNSLETNYSSSQDADDRYINYLEHFTDEHRRSSDRGSITPSLQQSREGNVEDLEEKTDIGNDDCGEDNEVLLEASEDDEANTKEDTPTKHDRQKKKKKKNSDAGRPKRTRRKCETEMAEDSWSPETIIIIALLAYVACKVLTFLVLLLPTSRNRRNK